MRILLAPSAYKGSFSPIQLGEALRAGVSEALPGAQTIVIPIADGGDGTIQAIHQAIGGELHKITVIGPLDFEVNANWLEVDKTSIVELASASGICHLQSRNAKLDCLRAHTFGTGQVIKSCLSTGTKNLVVCVGGSASTDGGMGLLSALGARFLDKSGKQVGNGGGALASIEVIDLSGLDSILETVTIQVATDVSNPLLGPMGAAAIYAPQKGASPADVALLESGLKHFADLLEACTNRQIRDLPGSGAAGATAFGLVCALNAKLVSGFAWLCDLVELKEQIEQSDLVITCEGSLDYQSLHGKATGELARICCEFGKPLWAIPAIADPEVDWQKSGIEKVLPAVSRDRKSVPASLDDVKRVCLQALKDASLEAKYK